MLQNFFKLTTLALDCKEHSHTFQWSNLVELGYLFFLNNFNTFFCNRCSTYIIHLSNFPNFFNILINY